MSNNKKRQFIQAYDDYADDLFRYSYFLVSSQEQAEEIVQDVYVKAWKYLGNGNEIINIRPFLYKICRNIIIDLYKKKAVGNKKEESLDQLLANNRQNFEPFNNGKEEIEKNVLLQETYEIIKKLPQNFRDILVMRFVEDLSPKEIAVIIGSSADRVSAKINRAIKKLQLYI